MQNALTLISLVLPIFLVIFIGIVLRYLNIITLEYNKISSKIIFNIALPLFLFKKISENNYTFEGSAGFILFAVVSTIIFFVLMWIVASLFKLSDEVRGVFIQGAFRGNYAIVGLALISSVLDHDSLVKSAMLIAFVLPLYNILAVIALAYPAKNVKGNFIKDILINPLVISVIIAFALNGIGFKTPQVIDQTIGYIAALTLPLALISIGASFSISEIKNISKSAVYSTLFKLVLQPLLFTPIAFYFGFTQEEIIILFIFFACPTAIASYIMAEAMNRDGQLAGSIVALSTLLSIVTISIGLYLLML